jgi:hypothetical protein
MGRAKALASWAWERNAVALTIIVLGAVWLDWLMGPRWAAMALAPICTHTAPSGLHCPACYAAVSLIGVGLGLALSRDVPPARARARK